MVKYVAVKDEKVIGQFYDEEIAKRFAKEEKAKVVLLKYSPLYDFTDESKK